MSSFTATFEHKTTGELVQVLCLDDYFGRHKYGYKVGDKILNEAEFDEQYKRVEE